MLEQKMNETGKKKLYDMDENVVFNAVSQQKKEGQWEIGSVKTRKSLSASICIIQW